MMTTENCFEEHLLKRPSKLPLHFKLIDRSVTDR